MRRPTKLIFRWIPHKGTKGHLLTRVVEVMHDLSVLPDGPTLLSVHRPPTEDAEGEYLVAVTDGQSGWHFHLESVLTSNGLKASIYPVKAERSTVQLG
jgi:hypothetical protein